MVERQEQLGEVLSADERSRQRAQRVAGVQSVLITGGAVDASDFFEAAEAALENRRTGRRALSDEEFFRQAMAGSGDQPRKGRPPKAQP